MSISPGWAALAGLVVGQVLALSTGWIQRRWTNSDLRRGRVETRAEDAAQSLLDQFAEVRQLNDGNHTQESTRDDAYQAEYELSHRMEREILLIPVAAVREALRKITMSLWFSEAAAQATGHSLPEVSFHLFAAGNEIVGAYLRGESLPDHASNIHLTQLERYHEAALARNALIERMLGRDEEVPPERR
jgi:hypothetical protein